MPRAVKEPLTRRNEILDVTQRFIYTLGYEKMTIQNIIDELKISKGAFYHYFDSKQALLEALIERIEDEVLLIIQPIVDDPSLSGLEKMNKVFSTAVRWKTEQIDFMMALLQVWYMDDNALVREKTTSGMLRRVSPMVAQVLRQGCAEGAFSTPFPDQVGVVVLSIVISQGDKFAELLKRFDPETSDIAEVEKIIAAYADAVERVLGAPSGSLTLMSPDTVRVWFPISANRSA